MENASDRWAGKRGTHKRVRFVNLSNLFVKLFLNLAKFGQKFVKFEKKFEKIWKCGEKRAPKAKKGGR